MHTPLDSALALASSGFRVFPAHGIVDGHCTCNKGPECPSAGKHPVITHWQSRATNDPVQVTEWWLRNSLCNPAVATGKGLVVLDVDGEEGMESLHRLEDIYGPLPPTRCVLTGRGKHYYYHSKLRLSNSTSLLGNKLDIRADGGYVIGAGGLHASGRTYTWEPGHSPADLPLAELPSWIPERLHRNTTAAKKDDPQEKTGFMLPEGMIPEGSRDLTLFRYGCYLRGVCGKDMHFIEKELFRINAEKCDPPLPDEQVRQKIHQVDQYPRAGGAEADFEPSRLICAADVKDEAVRFVMDPYIPEGQLTLIQGNPGDGKTAFACWLAANISTGKSINGIRCEQGNVLLLSVEDDMPVLKKRFVASGGDADCCFFVSNAAGLNFNSPEIEQYIVEKNIRTVIFDPLQAFLGAKVDMNRANETRPVLAALKEMAQRNRCAVVIISHINKGLKDGLAIQRSLGSMDIPGACRSILHIGRLDGDQDQRLMVHVKSSNAREGRSILFTIVTDGGVRFMDYTDKGYENLSELGRKTRKASGDSFLLNAVIDACRKLLEKYPRGKQVTYDELGVPWPAGVKPGPLLKSWRDQLDEAEISIMTGKRVSGKATIIVAPCRLLDPDEPLQSA